VSASGEVQELHESAADDLLETVGQDPQVFLEELVVPGEYLVRMSPSLTTRQTRRARACGTRSPITRLTICFASSSRSITVWRRRAPMFSVRSFVRSLIAAEFLYEAALDPRGLRARNLEA
jgi:hypothetical protein